MSLDNNGAQHGSGRFDDPVSHNGRGIALARLNRPGEAVTAFERAITLKPDYAEAYNNRALVLHDMMRFDDALADFDKAIALKPDNAVAHNNRGTVLLDLGRLAEALASFERAVLLKPDYAQAHYNSGVVLHDLKQHRASVASFERAIALKPDYAQAHHNRGAALQDLQCLDEAIAAYKSALALMPDYAESQTNLSYCYLQKGEFAEGWRLHEGRMRLSRLAGHRSMPQRLWLGREDISNKTLFIHWEQGFGDTIQFFRYGRILRDRGAQVIVSVQQELYRLLNQMEPGIEIIGQAQVPMVFDLHCPLMSLPLALRTTLETVPADASYIAADSSLRSAWNARLPQSAKPRVGLVWGGSSQHRNDSQRSIEFSALAPLLSADVQWISLQKEARPGDADLLRDSPRILAVGDDLRDFADTAAVIDCLDLVISVDTSIAHLAGAMGKPVWILLPFNSDWRWLLDRNDSPWYPSARLFRQRQFGSWSHVIAGVAHALQQFSPARSNRA
jgi:tetratricopeptide (TPR) repeat protein